MCHVEEKKVLGVKGKNKEVLCNESRRGRCYIKCHVKGKKKGVILLSVTSRGVT